MRANEKERYGLWELAVLALLRESPMHPYQMQKLLRERHKDDLLVLKRGSLYHAIRRLEVGSLIEVVRTGREGNRPERTTYSITALGKKELVHWLRQMIGVPRRESSDFMAALSFLPFLSVEEAIARLDERSRNLKAEIAELTANMRAVGSWVPRIHLIETEYLRAMREAELGWVRKLETELRSRTLTWDLRKLLKEPRVATTRAEAGSNTGKRLKKAGKETRR
jgi:DNA-binding PadR family transcriptional regulator